MNERVIRVRQGSKVYVPIALMFFVEGKYAYDDGLIVPFRLLIHLRMIGSRDYATNGNKHTKFVEELSNKWLAHDSSEHWWGVWSNHSWKIAPE